MQLGKALVGAIIGAALGIAALIAIQHFAQKDSTWLAIIVALLTGLGVRTMVSTSGHASYLRGAMTGVLALAAYWGGTQLFTYLVTQGILTKQIAAAPAVAADLKEAAKGEAGEGEAVAPVEPVVVQPSGPIPGGINRPRPPQEVNYWDMAWLCIAALLAYELGRGTSAPTTPPQQEVIPPPDAT